MMPAYNAERFIGQAVDSALAQTFADWELIVVNDGSTDATPDILARYADARIKVVHQANGGESIARNTALAHARGEHLAFLDADDLFLPRHLEVTAGALRERPDRGGVYTDGYYCDQDGARIKLLSSRRRGPFEGDLFEQTVRSSDTFGVPVCVVLRRAVIERHGLTFDPGIVIGPDWDFLNRFAEVATFGYVSEPTCLYRVHQTNISTRLRYQQRALHLARCREKAIKMNRFGACSLETRAYVFYDLLANLLVGSSERQAAITAWPEFRLLPAETRAWLLRLMASKAILSGQEGPQIQDWLRQSRSLHPAHPVSAALSLLYRLHPGLCKRLLTIRVAKQMEQWSGSPFADLTSA